MQVDRFDFSEKQVVRSQADEADRLRDDLGIAREGVLRVGERD